MTRVKFVLFCQLSGSEIDDIRRHERALGFAEALEPGFDEE